MPGMFCRHNRLTAKCPICSRELQEELRSKAPVRHVTPRKPGASSTPRSSSRSRGVVTRKLARAANLLRTRVDVEQERQNQELLQSMNTRTRLQLRLQATVEGLSVAAISYYVVGLFGYLVKGAHDSGLVHVEPSYATAAFVPFAVLFIWWLVRRIRKRHIAGEV